MTRDCPLSCPWAFHDHGPSEHSHPVPIDLKNGTNLQFDINVSGGNGMPGDIQTAKGYPGTLFRVYDLHKNQIHYYNGKGVYKTKSWKR